MSKKNKVGQIYYLSQIAYSKRIPILPKLLNLVNRVVFTADLPYSANIHENIQFGHNGMGVIINPNVVVDENTLIMQHVTLGGDMGKRRIINGRETSAPVIGKNVFIGAGAKVLGPIIIGDNAVIGAGAVVINDVPANSVAVGVPAKIIKENN